MWVIGGVRMWVIGGLGCNLYKDGLLGGWDVVYWGIKMWGYWGVSIWGY